MSYADDTASGRAASESFTRVYSAIVDSMDRFRGLAAEGATTVLLVTGMASFVVTLASKVFLNLTGSVSRSTELSSLDLGILVAGSLVLLLAGGGLRVLDRFMDDKAQERALRLRLEAADRAVAALKEIVPAPTSPTPRKPL
jgi:hypothetical protein